MSDIERLAYHVAEVAVALGLSRAQTYVMVGSGEIPSVRLGGRILVPADALRRKVAELAQQDEPHKVVVLPQHDKPQPDRKRRKRQDRAVGTPGSVRSLTR